MNFDNDVAFPRLSERQLAVLDAAGDRRALADGQVLFGSGDREPDFFALLSGQVAIVDAFGTPAERELGVHGEGRFVGELNLMSGEPAYLTALVREDGEAIVLSRAALVALIGRDQQLGDLILSAFVARRAILVDAGSGVRLIGSSLSGEGRRLREFLVRNRVPHSFVDLDGDREADPLLRELPFDPVDLPLLVRGSTVLRNPTNVEAATALNLRAEGKTAERAWDTLVVGAGPAGLGAAVYAGSEGLETVLVDAVALGGQASTSSRIENYLGFPAGLSGSELAERATLQARRFGVKTAVPERALSLTPDAGTYVLELDSGDRLRARTVVLATGASYRRLDVERVAEFEGAGVYYAATQMEAQTCQGEPVAVVGGGNSAGQAAVFLAGQVSRVSLLLRGGDLAADMSRYLVDQIERTVNIDVLLRTEIREMHGGDSLEAVTQEENSSGSTSRVVVRAVFVFIGADPCTDWLDGALVTDDDGFILTGRELQLAHLDPAADGRQRAPGPAGDQPSGRLCRRRRPLRIDQARRLGRRRGGDGRAADPRTPRSGARIGSFGSSKPGGSLPPGMNRLAVLSPLLALAAVVASVSWVTGAAADPSPFHPFGPKANSTALKEKIVEEFPDAQLPPREGTVCSTGEHSPDGPTSYCFVEFTAEGAWHLDEAAMTIDLVGGTGISIRIYSHTTWQRRWRRCGLRPGVPGKLFSNDDCGLGQPEQFSVESDGNIVELDVLPRIERHKPLRFVSRNFIYSGVVPFIAHYRAVKSNGLYAFTNALGDSFRYRP